MIHPCQSPKETCRCKSTGDRQDKHIVLNSAEKAEPSETPWHTYDSHTRSWPKQVELGLGLAARAIIIIIIIIIITIIIIIIIISSSIMSIMSNHIVVISARGISFRRRRAPRMDGVVRHATCSSFRVLVFRFILYIYIYIYNYIICHVRLF